MKISLIHPSRGRPNKSIDTVLYWLNKASFINDIEVIVSLDSSDKQVLNYTYETLYFNYLITVNDNDCVVKAVNIAAEHATGDILIYLSDDFKCPDNWDELVRKEFENENRPLLIKVDDCLQKFDIPVLTIPIMNRALYERLGYFFHPEYKSMFVDEHLYWVSRKLGALKPAPHLKFEHCHVSVGKSQDDETYRRSAANWDQGKALFKKHQAQGFPV